MAKLSGASGGGTKWPESACGFFPIVMRLPLSLPHFYRRGTHVPVFPSLQLRFYANTNQTNHRDGEMAQGI